MFEPNKYIKICLFVFNNIGGVRFFFYITLSTFFVSYYSILYTILPR